MGRTIDTPAVARPGASPGAPEAPPGRAAEAPVEGAPSLEEQYAAMIADCGVVDRSERGKLALTGPDAVTFLNGQVTNELADLLPGDGRYAAFLTHKGKMLGDLRVLAVGELADRGGEPVVRELLLDTERVALQPLFDMIRRFRVGYDLELHKRTLECGLLSLLGPRSLEVARAAVAEELDWEAREHGHVPATIAGHPVRLVGVAGGNVDVLIDLTDVQPEERAGGREAVWDALVAAGAAPTGEPAAEVLRVELGVPRFGLDMDETTIPQEAGLNERAVSFTKGCYVGQETVARLHYRGKPNRHLRGLRLSEPTATGAELRAGERVVGTLTSSVTSPRVGPIGLALVRREARPGDTVAVGDGAGRAEIVTLPFG